MTSRSARHAFLNEIETCMTSEVDTMETTHQRCPKKPLFGKDLLEGLGGLIIWRGLPPRLENAAGAAVGV